MIEDVLSKVELICPKCRKLSQGTLTQHPLILDQVTLKQQNYVLEGKLVCTNPQCNTKYPIIDGVPVIVKNLEEWLQNEYKTKTSTEQKTEDALTGLYMDNHYGEFTNAKNNYPWIKNKTYWNQINSIAQPQHRRLYETTLDLGCSVGRFTFELAKKSKLAVGLDSKYVSVHQACMLQRSKGKIKFTQKTRTLASQEVTGKFDASQNVFFLVGDALDPPFRMESFELVFALNLVDSIRVPLILLGQMDALLKPEGTLIIGSPYCWNPQTTDPVEWLETETADGHQTVKEILEGKTQKQCDFKYKIEKEIRNLPWTLKNQDSYFSVFLVNLLVAQKKEKQEEFRG
jgi:SAM-dependent methyltransferase/uncharacterized protein YbaR (Trm112 family)